MTTIATRLDHIAVIAPDLLTGISWVKDCLDIEAPIGGQHLQMGTHNHLLRLGPDFFLEIIATDPSQARPPHARWFGLDDTASIRRHWSEGRRLRGMVARTNALDAVLALAPDVLGHAMELTRGTRTWRFGVRDDGALPRSGAVPHVMDWGPQGPAAPQMPDLGCRLTALVAHVQDPIATQAFFKLIHLKSAPDVRQGGPDVQLTAVIETPSGVRVLT